MLCWLNQQLQSQHCLSVTRNPVYTNFMMLTAFVFILLGQRISGGLTDAHSFLIYFINYQAFLHRKYRENQNTHIRCAKCFDLAACSRSRLFSSCLELRSEQDFLFLILKSLPLKQDLGNVVLIIEEFDLIFMHEHVWLWCQEQSDFQNGVDMSLWLLISESSVCFLYTLAHRSP